MVCLDGGVFFKSQIQKIAQAQELKPGKLFSVLKEPISEVCHRREGTSYSVTCILLYIVIHVTGAKLAILYFQLNKQFSYSNKLT